MQQLLSAGVHFGHQVRRGHPKMAPFIYGAREGVHIMDLEKSEAKLREATEKAYELGKAGKVLLVVGTKKQAKDIVKALALNAETPYLTEKWVSGLLTNFDEIRKNVKKLVGLKEQQQKGELTMYTKKEQLLISRKVERFDKELGGIAEMDKLPEALFVVDGVSNDTALKEGRKKGILIIGVSDTNANPNDFDFPIPANDDGIKSIKLVAETVINAYSEGKIAGVKAATEAAATAEASAKAAEAKEAEKAAKAASAPSETELDAPVAEEAAAIEEEIEKEVVQESERKV
jgi:small subunit ribosomal protein S2